MEEEDAHDTVAEYAPETQRLPLGQMYQPKDKDEEEQQHQGTAHEALLLAHGTEYEIRILLGDVFQLGLRAVEEALAVQSAGPYGYLGLNYVVSGPLRVVFQTQKYADASLLMRLQDIIQHIIDRIEKADTAYGEQGYQGIGPQLFAHSQVEQVSHHGDQHGPLHPADIERYEVLGIQQRQHVGRGAQKQHLQERLAQRCVHPHQPHGKQVYACQYKELTHAHLRQLPHRFLGIAYANHKVKHKRRRGKQYAANHALAVKHQEEGQIDQGGTRFPLHDDQHHRQKHQEATYEEVDPSRQV